MYRHAAKLYQHTFRHLSKTVVASALFVVLFLMSASLANAATTSVYLESHNATDAPSGSFCSGASLLAPTTPPGCGSEVTAPVVLASGTSYTATVTGAVSAWGSWPFNRCGKPEPSSQFASPGISNKPAGDDAQFRFAIPLYGIKCHFKVQKTAYFQANLGGGWFHPVAVNGPSKPSGDNKSPTEQHPYTFTFVGEGVAPQFRYIDHHPSDNSGQFKIAITG